ncbi:MAG: PAS domain S-box protein [Desulfohalobiaceae bacterium]|nr:PAS domain S-box protein [Desulfohalobiaceae bacterium]
MQLPNLENRESMTPETNHKPMHTCIPSNKNKAQALDELAARRRGLLYGMLIVLSALGLPALVIASIEAVQLDRMLGIALYGLLYLVFVVAALCFKRLPFPVSAGVVLAGLYLIACYNLVHYSFAGAGNELLLTISVLATLLLGMRGGIATAGVCLLTIIGIGFCFVFEAIAVLSEMPSTTAEPSSWAAAAAVFSLLAGALVLGAGMLQANLIRSVKTIQHQAEELKRANEDLSREVEQRRAVEERLKHSESKFKALFELAPDAIYLQDLQGRLLDGNQAAERLIGTSRSTLKGKYFQTLELVSSEELQKAAALLERNRNDEPTGPDELTLKSRNGSSVIVEIRTCPFRLGKRQVVLGIARDVSERKRLETHLNQSQKLESLGTLAGGIAHDFNNILSAVIGYTDLALSEAAKGTFLHDNLSAVLSAGNRAKELVAQILAISRPEDQSRHPVQINPLVKEALKMLRSTVPTSIEFREKIGKEPLVVRVNPTQLHQVIMNLTTNAMQAMTNQEGLLEVCLDSVSFGENRAGQGLDLSPGEYACLTISDTGVGIPGQHLEKIFEPYFTTKEKGTGTGLGLSVVQGIVKSHGGHVIVSSEPGEGTTFSVYLPLTQKDMSQVRAEAEAPLPTGSERILFVDDEPPIVKMQQQSLERLGYTVTATSSSTEALKRFRLSPDTFDLLITDMTMPSLTGDKLTAAVKAMRPGLPVILCTGFSEKINGNWETPALDGILMKPVDKAEMAAAIRRALDRSDTDLVCRNPARRSRESLSLYSTGLA